MKLFRSFKKDPETGKRPVVAIGAWKLVVIGFLVLGALSVSGVWVASDSNTSCILCHSQHGESWSSGTHQGIHCVDCHVDPGASGSVRAKIRGVHNLCVALIRGNEVERGHDPLPVSSENCMACHHGILRHNELGDLDLPDNSLMMTGLVMAHRVHVEDHAIDCVWCHRGVVHRNPEDVGKYEFNMPLHNDCMACHNGEHLEEFDTTLGKLDEQDSCVTCHPYYEPQPDYASYD